VGRLFRRTGELTAVPSLPGLTRQFIAFKKASCEN
jgi:hypothetical protein